MRKVRQGEEKSNKPRMNEKVIAGVTWSRPLKSHENAQNSPMEDGVMGYLSSYSHSPLIKSNPKDINSSAFLGGTKGHTASSCHARESRHSAKTGDRSPGVQRRQHAGNCLQQLQVNSCGPRAMNSG